MVIFRSRYPDVAIPNVSLTDFVFEHVADWADRVALVDAVTGRELTYRELVDRIRRLAAGLAARGIAKGDVVAIWAPNLPEYAVVFHGIMRLGAVVTTANPVSTDEEVASQLQNAGARMIFTTVALLERAQRIAAALSAKRDAASAAAGAYRQSAHADVDQRSVVEVIAIDGTMSSPQAGVPVAAQPPAPTLDDICIDAEPPDVVIDPAEDVAVMPYSSGTTGLPKGVMLTHRNLVVNLAQLDAVETEESKALLGVLPFFHIYAMVILLNRGLRIGATVVSMQRFDFETMLRVLQDWPIATAHVVPPVVLALAKSPLVDRYDLSGLKVVFCAAAPLGPELTLAAEARLALCIRQGYGMTEASPVTHYTGPGHERSGKAGLLVPSTECRMVDPASGTDVGVGERGEVWIRGPQVMKGYLNSPEATALTVDADGWLHTGDIGTVDADGYLEIVDRLKELIKVKGYQVAPAELEALLLTHPEIADAAVIPVADTECGEVPKAFVVRRGPCEAAAIVSFVESHVAHYKRIRDVAFVDAIPKSPSGKILRRMLIERERGR